MLVFAATVKQWATLLEKDSCNDAPQIRCVAPRRRDYPGLEEDDFKSRHFCAAAELLLRRTELRAGRHQHHNCQDSISH